MSWLVAGVQSGCGKTTVTLALMQWLRAQGVRVAPFKAGPDFLDPMWHRVVCGRDSYNLDTRMMGEDHCRRLLAEHAADADVAVIEGAMGMFDGAEGVGGVGSSAHLARALEMPVLLVVDARGMSGSLVPLVEGFLARAGAMGVEIVGVVANRVGSPRHAAMLDRMLRTHGLPPLLAWLEKGAPSLPERHLGLTMPDERACPDWRPFFHAQGLLERRMRAPASRVRSVAATPLLRDCTVAIAKDAAFCFIYPANLDWLRAMGARVRFFSPLAGEPVPAGADALWLPGGYPELHLDTLSLSPSLASMRAFIEAGGCALAECGGMMVLGERIGALDGAKDAAMAGVLPCRFDMRPRVVSLGYREEASGVRGHEFHHSERLSRASLAPAFEVDRGDCGVRYRGLRASYVHWYFASGSEAVARWLAHGEGVG